LRRACRGISWLEEEESTKSDRLQTSCYRAKIREVQMCIAIVYLDSGGARKEAMRNVIRVEAKDSGLHLVGLLGEGEYLEGRLKGVDFW